MAASSCPECHALLGKPLEVSARIMWAIYWVGAGSFLPLLFLQSVGEEGIWPIITQEMWARKDFIVTTLYGGSYGRPGLYSWLMLIPTAVLGEQHVRIAARLVAASSTLAIGLTVAWLARKLFRDRLFAAFAAAVFLSGDTLFQRGWIAYADPTFSMFTFAAMACLWVATEERRLGLLVLAGLGLIGSFLTKVITGYLFYGVLVLVLLWRHRNRRFLLGPGSVLIHLGAAAFPIIWNYLIASDSVFPPAAAKILLLAQNEDAPNIVTYAKLFVAYPFRVIWHLMPVSAIVVYCLLARRISFDALRHNSVVIASATVAINLVPYWLVPGSSGRYLMPLYPLCALVLTYVVLNSGKFIIDLSTKALIVTVGIAYVAALVGFPLYEYYFRGNYDKAAQAIIARAGNLPIFITDDSAIGLSIAASIDVQRLPLPPITCPPSDFKSGFVISVYPTPAIGQIDMKFRLGRDAAGKRTRYLLCRGDACAAPGKPSATELSF